MRAGVDRCLRVHRLGGDDPVVATRDLRGVAGGVRFRENLAGAGEPEAALLDSPNVLRV